jgi:hypothetical protein
LAIRARRTRAREEAAHGHRARAAIETRVGQALDDSRARWSTKAGRAAAHGLVVDAAVAERAVDIVAEVSLLRGTSIRWSEDALEQQLETNNVLV